MRRAFSTTAAASLLLCSCTTPPQEKPAAARPPAAPAATPAAPGGRHPLVDTVVGDAPEGAPAPPPASDGVVRAADVTFVAPTRWSAAPPSSNMRVAQWLIPGPGGDAEAVVYFFGTGQGGGVDANVQRWLGQFQPEEGTAPSSGRESREVGGLKVTIVRARGTYASGMPGQPATPLEGQALYGVIIESPGGPVFLKATGPASTLDAAGAELEALVATVRVAA